jgi:hypothetical protein
MRPANGREQHHAEPAQPADLDEMAARRAHGVAVNAACGDAQPAPALDRVVDTQHDGSVGHEGAYQHPQQHACCHPWRPHRAAQNAMEVHEVRFAGQAQYPQHAGDGARAGHQHRAYEQQLGMLPSALTKQPGEAQNDLREAGRQSSHDLLPCPEEKSVYEPVRFAFAAQEWPKSSSDVCK